MDPTRVDSRDVQRKILHPRRHAIRVPVRCHEVGFERTPDPRVRA